MKEGLPFQQMLQKGGIESDVGQEHLASYLEEELFAAKANTARGMGILPIYHDIQTSITSLKKVRPQQLEFAFQVFTQRLDALSEDADIAQIHFPLPDRHNSALKAKLKQQTANFCSSAMSLTSSILQQLCVDKVRDNSMLQDSISTITRGWSQTVATGSNLVLVIASDGSAYWDNNQQICAGVGLCVHLIPKEFLSWRSVQDQAGNNDRKIFGQDTTKKDKEGIATTENLISTSLTTAVTSPTLLTSALDAELFAFLIGTSLSRAILQQLMTQRGVLIQEVHFVSDSKSLLQILRQQPVVDEETDMTIKQAACQAWQQLQRQYPQQEIGIHWHGGHPERIEANPERWELLDRMLWNADWSASATKKADSTSLPLFGASSPPLDIQTAFGH